MTGPRLKPPQALLAAVLTLGLGAALPSPSPAQAVGASATTTGPERTKTLADIRNELDGLYAQIHGLQKELTPGTGGTSGAPQMSGSVQERLDAITAQLQQLTNQTEELQHRVGTVVQDGTRRIGDLNFRLCELEKGCDIGKLKKTPLLGVAIPTGVGGAGQGQGQGQAAGGATAGGANGTAPNEMATVSVAPDLAVGEQADFDRAEAALTAKKYQDAANLFRTFTQTYTAGPLTGQAHFYRGQALAAMGQTANAARSYLNSFSGAPDGPRAPDALTQLGISLGKLGQVEDACVTLSQVKVRYPASSAVQDAKAARQSLGCK